MRSPNGGSVRPRGNLAHGPEPESLRCLVVAKDEELREQLRGWARLTGAAVAVESDPAAPPECASHDLVVVVLADGHDLDVLKWTDGARTPP
jgi:hypothetical protein